MFEQVEKVRQRQTCAMERFAQAQARLAQIEARLQVLHERHSALPTSQSQQQGISPGSGDFLPANGDLELQQDFVTIQEEEPTERLRPLDQTPPEQP